MKGLEPGRIVFAHRDEIPAAWKDRPLVIAGVLHGSYLVVALSTQLRRPDRNVIINADGCNLLPADSMAVCNRVIFLYHRAVRNHLGVISRDELVDIQRRVCATVADAVESKEIQV